MVGVWVLFSALIMHSMSCLSLAIHQHGVVEQVQLISHVGIIASGGLLLKVHAFTNVKNLVNLLAWSVWAMRWTTLLCVAIISPFDMLVCAFRQEMCLCHCWDILCSWILDVWLTRRYSFYSGPYILCVSEFQGLGDLCVKDAWGLLEGIGQLVVDLFIC